MPPKVTIKLPARPPAAAGPGGGGGGGAAGGSTPPSDPIPSAPVPLASAPLASSAPTSADLAAGHTRALLAASPSLLSPPPTDFQARWGAVLAGVRGLAAASGDGCLHAVAADLMARAYDRKAPAAEPSGAPAATTPDRVLLDDVLAVAVVSLPPLALRVGLFAPLAAGVAAGRVTYARRAPPFHALVSACGGGGDEGDDGSDDDDGAALRPLDDGPAAVLGAIADAAGASGTSPGGRSALAAWAGDTLAACPAGPSRARRMAGLVATDPVLAASAAARHAGALQAPAAWAALAMSGDETAPIHPDLAPCVAGLANAGSPSDVRRGALAAMRCGSSPRLAGFVDAVCGGSGSSSTGGTPDAPLSARVGAVLGALCTAASTTPGPLEALLSRPGLESDLDPADAVGGVYGRRRQHGVGVVPAAVLSAWARAAAEWLGHAASAGDAGACTARAIWLAQCAALVEEGSSSGDGDGLFSSFTPILAAGLGTAGAALPSPVVAALATALLTRAPGVPPSLAARAVRALADGAGPDRGPGLLAAAGAAAVRVAAAAALVDGNERRNRGGASVEHALAIMGSDGAAQRPDVARALAVLAAVEK